MSKEKNIKTNELFKQDKFLGIFVHLLTGFGIVAGFFALKWLFGLSRNDLVYDLISLKIYHYY